MTAARLRTPRRFSRLLGFIALAALVALACVPAAGDAATRRRPKLKVVYVEDKGVVEPGTANGSSESCPKAAPHAIGGYFGSDTQADTPLIAMTQSVPFGKGRKWSIGVRDLTDQPQAFFVGAVCASGGPYKLAPAHGAVDPGKTDGFDVRCPSKFPKPIAGYFFPGGEDTGQLVLASSLPGGRAWTTVVKNLTDQPQEWGGGAVCAPKSLKVDYLSTSRGSVQPGKADGATGTCGRKTPHAAGGFFGIPAEMEFGNLTMAASYPAGAAGRAWSTAVANQNADPQDYVVGSTCIG